MYGPPVDLSFKNLSNVSDALSETPRPGLRPLNTNSRKKYISRSLRLSNNCITHLSGLHRVLYHFLAKPSDLGWLDLSFNKIPVIEPVLHELRQLRVLYFHGNCICNLSDVNMLGELQHLHTITLHGNEIARLNFYRKYVISVLPRLKTMDFSAVTHEERVLANVWYHSMKLGKRHKAESPVAVSSSSSE